MDADAATLPDSVTELSLERDTFANQLRKAGYATAMIGKWGQLTPSGDPAEWGFDHDFHFKGSGMYWNSDRAKKMTDDGKVRGDPDTYVLDGKQYLSVLVGWGGATGLYVGNRFLRYTADEIVDRNGRPLPVKGLDVVMINRGVSGELSAQAAQLTGDRDGAKRAFDAMLDDEQMAFLGLRGLIERDHAFLAVVGNQHAGLFKRFANGCHPIGQAAALDTQRPARNLIRHAGAQGLQLGGFVLCIKRAAGKNVRRTLVIQADAATDLALRAGSLKLITGRGGPQLYDLAADPAEEHDVAASNPDETKRLEGLLDRKIAAMPLAPRSAQAVDPRLRETLRALGYAE